MTHERWREWNVHLVCVPFSWFSPVPLAAVQRPLGGAICSQFWLTLPGPVWSPTGAAEHLGGLESVPGTPLDAAGPSGASRIMHLWTMWSK